MITNLRVTGPNKGITRDLQGDYAVVGDMPTKSNCIIAEFFNQLGHQEFADAQQHAEIFKHALEQYIMAKPK